MKGHAFDPGYSGMSAECERLVIRDGYGDHCGMTYGEHEFRHRVRSILTDRASLDESHEEFFDEILDDIAAVFTDLAGGA